jgi:SAM-dependent methyltransferase
MEARGKAATKRGIARVIDWDIAARTEDIKRDARAALHRVDELEREFAPLTQALVEEEVLASAVGGEVEATRVNLELLKGEVRALEHTLDEFGMAIAPATGLAGVGARFAELRERVNGLDRRLRSQQPAGNQQSTGEVRDPGRPAGNGEAAAAAAPQSALFDYVGFERRFRGDPAVVSRDLESRYGDLLAANPPVVDVGCGRAELVAWLTARGIEAIGVDTDPSMVAEARGRGLNIRQQDALSFLRECPARSLGSILATHLLEHLQLDDLVQLLELAVSRLRPGGIFVAETPNPASLIVLGNSYVMDPTHVRPLHPSLLSFLCEGAGFRDVRLRFYAPAEGYHLPLVQDPEAPSWVESVNIGFGRLNEVLFGPQDYAVVATTPPFEAD